MPLLSSACVGLAWHNTRNKEGAIMDPANFRELYKTELQEACSLETQLVQALPKMAEAAHDPGLKQAILSHLDETRGHEQQLREVLQRHDAEARGHTDQSMQAMIHEAAKWARMVKDPSLRDAGVIASAQRIEHYEIAVYGTLATWAKQLGLDDDLKVLHGILQQEKSADDTLTGLAKSTVNRQAVAA
jgi:ferritin-like metal-binding protein YciE